MYKLKACFRCFVNPVYIDVTNSDFQIPKLLLTETHLAEV
jgi:hypothetical protein